MIKTKYLLSLSLFFVSTFSLSASSIALDFSEKAHIRVHSKNSSNPHQVDRLNSVELHQVTEDVFQYDALGSTVRPGWGGAGAVLVGYAAYE